jgi:hypothetical protein
MTTLAEAMQVIADNVNQQAQIEAPFPTAPGIIPSPIVVGFDAATSVINVLSKAKAAGVAWIGRYFSFNSRKNLTPDEAQAILNAGIDIVSIWEANGNLFSSFTEANGLREATSALQQAQACGQPYGTCIYFAVDFDASQSQIISGIIPYFRAVNEILNGHYTVGVYGSGLVCSQLDAAELVTYDFLAGAMGWQGSRAYSNAHLTEIEQSVNVDPWGFGFPIDQDMAPANRGFGSWKSSIEPIPTPAPAPVPVVDITALILMLQQALKDQGFYKSKVDGDFGPLSYNAYRAWRSS